MVTLAKWVVVPTQLLADIVVLHEKTKVLRLVHTIFSSQPARLLVVFWIDILDVGFG